MDAKLKADWVKTLRSGEYKQGQVQLQDGEYFCCLGVLCKVAGLKISEGGGGVVISGEDMDYQPLREMLGLIHDRDACASLYQKNDSGETFSVIADYIEANL